MVSRSWLSIEVELVSGRGEVFWPRPGRLFVAKPGFTFRQLAVGINEAFARWDAAHLHHFVLEDGTEIVPLEWWDDPEGTEVDDSATLSRLSVGERFAYEFDFGDGWEHLCTVIDENVDPVEVYGVVPKGPAVYWGWGDLPDQYGRRWRDDFGEGDVPPAPDPPLSDLPPLLYGWGTR